MSQPNFKPFSGPVARLNALSTIVEALCYDENGNSLCVSAASSQQQLQSLVDRLQNPKPYNTFLLIKLCDHARPTKPTWLKRKRKIRFSTTIWGCFSRLRFRDCVLGLGSYVFNPKYRNVGLWLLVIFVTQLRWSLFWFPAFYSNLPSAYCVKKSNIGHRIFLKLSFYSTILFAKSVCRIKTFLNQCCS